MFAENFTTLDKITQEVLSDKMCNKSAPTVQPSPFRPLSSSMWTQGTSDGVSFSAFSLDIEPCDNGLAIRPKNRQTIANFVRILH